MAVKQDLLIYIPGFTYTSRGPLWIDALKLEAFIANQSIPTYIAAQTNKEDTNPKFIEGKYAFRTENLSNTTSPIKSNEDKVKTHMYDAEGRPEINHDYALFYDYIKENNGEYSHIITTRSIERNGDNDLNITPECSNLNIDFHDGVFLVKLDELNTDIQFKFTFYSKIDRTTIGEIPDPEKDPDSNTTIDLDEYILDKFAEIGTWESYYNPLTSGVNTSDWRIVPQEDLLQMYRDLGESGDWDVPVIGDFLVGKLNGNQFQAEKYDFEDGYIDDPCPKHSFSLEDSDAAEKLFDYYKGTVHDKINTSALKQWEELFNNDICETLPVQNPVKDKWMGIYSWVNDGSYHNSTRVTFSKVNTAPQYSVSLKNTSFNLDSFNYLYNRLPEFNITNFLQEDDVCPVEVYVPMFCPREPRDGATITKGLVENWGRDYDYYGNVNSYTTFLLGCLVSPEPILLKSDTIKGEWNDCFWSDKGITHGMPSFAYGTRCVYDYLQIDHSDKSCESEMTPFGKNYDSTFNLTVEQKSSQGGELISNKCKRDNVQYWTSSISGYKNPDYGFNPMFHSAARFAKQLYDRGDGDDKYMPITTKANWENGGNAKNSQHPEWVKALDYGRGAGVYMPIRNISSKNICSPGEHSISGGTITLNFNGSVDVLALKYAETKYGAFLGTSTLAAGYGYCENNYPTNNPLQYKTIPNKFSPTTDKNHFGIGFPVINIATTWYIDPDKSQLTFSNTSDYQLSPMLTIPELGYYYNGSGLVQQPVNVEYHNYITGQDEIDEQGLIIDEEDFDCLGEYKYELSEIDEKYKSTFLEKEYYKIPDQKTISFKIDKKDLSTGIYALKINSSHYLNADVTINDQVGQLNQNKVVFYYILNQNNQDLSIEINNLSISSTENSEETSSETPYIQGIGLYRVSDTASDINTQQLKQWADREYADSIKNVNIIEKVENDTNTEKYLNMIIFPSTICAKEEIEFCKWEGDTSIEERVSRKYLAYYLPSNPIYEIEAYFKVPVGTSLAEDSLVKFKDGSNDLAKTLDGVQVKFLN